jgi:RNA polymerase sigma factor (sigma-70 family)
MRTKEEVAKLIEENRGWIYRVAKKLSSRLPKGMTFDELLHEAEIAFMRAAQTFDPKKAKISTYSHATMINNVTRYLDYQHRRGFSNLGDRTGKFSALHGVKILQGGTPFAGSEDDPVTLIDTLGEPERQIPVTWTEEQWQDILRHLPTRESKVLWERLVIGRKLTDIGQEQKLSDERVRQIYGRAIRRLRELVQKRAIRCEHLMEHA